MHVNLARNHDLGRAQGVLNGCKQKDCPACFRHKAGGDQDVPLVKELRSRSDFNVVVCVTGQHRQMLDAVLDVFEVEPDYDLQIMKQSQTLFNVTTAVLNGLRPIISRVNRLPFWFMAIPPPRLLQPWPVSIWECRSGMLKLD